LPTAPARLAAMAIAGSRNPGNVTAIESIFVIMTSLLEASAGSR
jgi:hypothetical protein